jgi:CheY-like chemotaxis protein
MHMNRLTGLDTIRHLKVVHATAPGILITADATDELRRHAHDVAAFSVLKKPVTKGELVTTVSSALELAYDDPSVSMSIGRG